MSPFLHAETIPRVIAEDLYTFDTRAYSDVLNDRISLRGSSKQHKFGTQHAVGRLEAGKLLRFGIRRTLKNLTATRQVGAPTESLRSAL